MALNLLLKDKQGAIREVALLGYSSAGNVIARHQRTMRFLCAQRHEFICAPKACTHVYL